LVIRAVGSSEKSEVRQEQLQLGVLIMTKSLTIESYSTKKIC
jgi:hypothetical protein